VLWEPGMLTNESQTSCMALVLNWTNGRGFAVMLELTAAG
jgi:hypothetical protein